MEIKNSFYPINRKEWHNWLLKNHKIESEIWVIYFKKHTGKHRVSYEDAVEEALCFGWIDSTVKKIDDEKYCQKFTPRKIKSEWSEINKKRVEKLILSKRMQKSGLEIIDIAKKNGMWTKKTVAAQNFSTPNELIMLLNISKKAKIYFEKLSPSYKKKYISWIASAKKEETRKRRAEKAIELLESEKKLGI